jgi:uncharacterized membrane protein
MLSKGSKDRALHPTPTPPKAIARERWDAIDVARGVAIVAMVVYHFTWDLSFLKLIATNIVEIPAWQWFAKSIAGSFLTLVGIGLALAHAGGFKPWTFLRRLLKVGGAAFVITVATYFAFPDSYIFFGVLHCIAAASVFALPFLRAPRIVTLAAAIACLAAPHIFRDPTLDHPLLDWLGLGLLEPRTNDYVPIFPWFGLVLIGIAVGKSLLRQREAVPLARWRARNPLTRALAGAGRHSLPIYLLHQPVLLALLFGLVQITGPNPVAEAAPFMRECQANCSQGGSSPASCQATCGCVVDNLRQSGLWPQVLADQVEADDQTRVSGLVQQCLRRRPP